MDLFDKIREDHTLVNMLFKQLEQLSDRASRTRQRLVNQLCTMLESHTMAEEQVFYPLIQRKDDGQELVMDAQEAHHVIQVLIGELRRMPVNDPHFNAKLKVMRDNVAMHVDEEESQIIPMAEQMVNAEQARDLAQRFVDIENTVQMAIQRRAA